MTVPDLQLLDQLRDAINSHDGARGGVLRGGLPGRIATLNDRGFVPIFIGGSGACPVSIRRSSGMTGSEHAEVNRLKRENAELRRANEILQSASAFLQRSSTVP